MVAADAARARWYQTRDPMRGQWAGVNHHDSGRPRTVDVFASTQPRKPRTVEFTAG
jgi:hypothetical protein